MRPLTLKFAGLRSYLAEQVIDFTDVNLMAIVGDTGAGKSSILEALCFALYGVSTWDARSGKGLIADGGDGTVRAELTFRAKGKTWRVTRTTSAGGYPPSTHRLVCLDDDSIRMENARGGVDTEIRRLVGLDHATFLKAVVLPQGRFQELLQTPEGPRTGILKTVLGLEHITEVRNQAKVAHERLDPQLTELRVRRARLLDNPEQTLREALQQLSDAEAETTRLQGVRTAVTEARKTHTEATRRAQEHRSTANRLETRIPADAAARYRELIDLDAELRRDLTAAEDELRDIEARVAERVAVLDEADAAGTGVADIASTLTTLRSLLDQLPGIDEEHRQHNAEATDIDTARAELRERNRAHVEIAHRTEQAHAHATELDNAHKAAVGTLERYRRLLADARHAATAVETVTTQTEAARQKAEHAENAVTEAQVASTRADKQAAEADEHVEAVSRRNAAAEAAAHSTPGDPCPVCTRTLPEDFTAPDTADLARAKTARTRARKDARVRGEELAAATESSKAAKAAVDDALSDLRDAAGQHEIAVELVTSGLGEVDLDLGDETLLASEHAKVLQAAEAQQAAATAARTAQDAKTRDITEIRAAETNLAKRATALSKSRETLKRRQAKLKRSYDALPAVYRPNTELSVTAVDHAIALAEHRQSELEKVTTALKATQTEATRLRDTVGRVTTDIQKKVTRPAEKLSRTVHDVAAHATAASGLTGLPLMPERPEPVSVVTDARWATETLDQAGKTIRRYHDEASAQDALATRAVATAEEALAGLGVSTSEELDEMLSTAKIKAQMAERTRDTARDQQPKCAELDRSIAAITPVIDSLRDINALLADGKFLAVVVKRRQRALLGIASDVLRSMTEGRFGFSDDFRILDTHTGQPRDVKTLSGGETFLASLALALALVELTSRGGGRVEALFLDEGFGSLDANVLGEALETLTGQATGGRLVAVISHMRAVAENFDNVLMVTRALSGGSRAHWMNPAERDQLVADDLSAGLLT
ncbi:SMC family ATPase [Saccharopolyspora shandongensis]|uniref:SMC family ATPase n=1 Tax=Saccharopolyspora shandongensis TaxID=418495 RepID=UPI0033C81BE0